MKAFKYFSILTQPLVAYISFTSEGWLTHLPAIFSFRLVPSLEFFIKPNKQNFSKEEGKIEKENKFYAYLVYLTLPIQLLFLVFFLYAIQEANLTNSEIFGRVFGMGIMCEVLGIHVGQFLLFNLSRHSDHHYNRSKPHQLLKSLPESRQIPTGYLGIMLISFFPPLWFLVMNKKLKQLR